MAYWFVLQGRTFDVESQGGFLWAPLYTENKFGVRSDRYFWSNMERLEVGDLVFCCVDQRIRAIASVIERYVIAPRPAGLPQEAWVEEGRFVRVAYELLDPTINTHDALASLFALQDEHGPIQGGSYKQSYLHGVSEAFARRLLSLGNIEVTEAAATRAVARTAPDETTRQRIVSSRVGQGYFRDNLLEYWGGSCAVSGVNNASLLRAAHIKSWKSSNDVERLDTYNGILLLVSYDIAFEIGLISFASDGSIMISNRADERDLRALAIRSDARLSRTDDRHLPFLAYHRQNRFVT